MSEQEIRSNFITELRRGTLTMAVLGCLKQPQYGYALLTTLEEKHVEIEANTLYPLLRRLEVQGLLESDWDTTLSRPRKYYKINEAGRAVFFALTDEWEKMRESMKMICAGGDDR